MVSFSSHSDPNASATAPVPIKLWARYKQKTAGIWSR